MPQSSSLFFYALSAALLYWRTEETQALLFGRRPGTTFHARFASATSFLYGPSGEQKPNQKQWNGKGDFAASKFPLIDVRTCETFAVGHVAGATNIPLEDLTRRMFELPAPHESPLTLCAACPEELADASALLGGKGWHIVHEHSFCAFRASPNEQPSHYGFDWETGNESVSCWRPSAFLRETLAASLTSEFGALNQLMQAHGAFPAKRSTPQTVSGMGERAARGDEENVGWNPGGKKTDATGQQRPRFVALDLGCGSGRDAVHMALTLPKDVDWQVIGVDNHRAALDRARALAEREGVAHRVHFQCADLRKLTAAGNLEELLHGVFWDGGDSSAGGGIFSSPIVGLVHGCRFLDRRLLKCLRDDEALLSPGGILIWSTFMEGEKNLAPPFRPSRRLFPGEMKHIFCTERRGESEVDVTTLPSFRILHDKEGFLTTRNTDVPASFFACQRT